MNIKGETLDYSFQLIEVDCQTQEERIITLDEIKDIWFTINSDFTNNCVVLKYSKGEINYNSELEKFTISLTQEQTLRLRQYNDFDVKVYNNDDKVIISYRDKLEDLLEPNNHEIMEVEQLSV